MIGTTINNYKIVKIIGKGGMGNVYYAQHETLNRCAAIKMLHMDLTHKEQVTKRFEQEAKLLDDLNHDNIVKLLDFGIHDGRPYLLMEHIDGKAFDDYIKTVSGPVPEEKALEYILQVLEAVGYAHKKGIVHRDIKPSNFMITESGKIKILDFGIAKIISEDGDALKTKTGQRIGSLAYMSPEQIKGGKIDAKTDIYSIGVALMQMVTGREPYSKEMSEWDISHEIVYEKLPRIKDIYPHASDAVQNIIDKATSKDLNDRYSTCEEFAQSVKVVKNLLESSKQVPQELIEMVQEFAVDGKLSKVEEIALKSYANLNNIDYANIILPLLNSEIEKVNESKKTIQKEEIQYKKTEQTPVFNNTSTMIDDDTGKTKLFSDDENLEPEVKIDYPIPEKKKKSKLPIIIGISIIVIAIIIIFALPTLKENSAYNKAVDKYTVESFQDYLVEYPEGKHIDDANFEIEAIRYKNAEQENTVEALKGYLEIYPEGKFADAAQTIINTLKKEQYDIYTKNGDDYFSKGEEFFKQSLENYKLALNTDYDNEQASKNIQKVENQINTLVNKYRQGIKQLVGYFGECDKDVIDYCHKILALTDDAEASRIINKCK